MSIKRVGLETKRILGTPSIERTDKVPGIFDFTLIKTPEQGAVEEVIAKDMLEKYDSVPLHKKEKEELRQKQKMNEAKLLSNRELNQKEAEQADYHLTHGNPFLFAWHWAKSKPWLLGGLEEGDTFTNIGTPPALFTSPIRPLQLLATTGSTYVGGELGERYLGGESGRAVGELAGMTLLPSVYGRAKRYRDAFWDGYFNAQERRSISVPLETIESSPLSLRYKTQQQITSLEPLTYQLLEYSVPTSGKTYYGSRTNLPSTFPTITTYDSPGNRELFRLKFNKWNKRYGYPMIPKTLVLDPPVFDLAIKDRLNQHNTFLRGVFVDTKAKGYPKVLEKLLEEGLEPTKQNALEFLATHYLPESGHGGRAGFGNIPYVRQHMGRGENPYSSVGTIYVSNGLGLAAGYAHRNGSHLYNGVFEVRRPLSFLGSREDWVLNGDFPLYSGGDWARDQSYYLYELPYLMSAGKAVPKLAKIDWNRVNYELASKRTPTLWDKQDYDRILKIYEALGITPHINNFGIGTPFLNYRVSKIANLLSNMEDMDRSEAFHTAFSPADEAQRAFLSDFGYSEKELLTPKEFYKRRLQLTYTPEILKKFEFIVNSKKYRDNLYKKYKEDLDEYKKRVIKQNTSYTTPEEIEKFVLDAGVTPNTPILTIGTSEPLRTSTINSNPEKAFLHVIFAGEPWTKGLEIVRLIPYEEWKDLHKTTYHTGTWSEGTSRKSKKFGGKLEKEV